MRGLLDSGRKVLAALLLILPGIVSDLIAVVLLLLPINVGSRFAPAPVGMGGAYRRGGNSDALDGDYRRVE